MSISATYDPADDKIRMRRGRPHGDQIRTYEARCTLADAESRLGL